jgi:hypothetical protein
MLVNGIWYSVILFVVLFVVKIIVAPVLLTWGWVFAPFAIAVVFFVLLVFVFALVK